MKCRTISDSGPCALGPDTKVTRWILYLVGSVINTGSRIHLQFEYCNMGDSMDVEEKSRNDRRKRTLADLMAESNEPDAHEIINVDAPSTSSAPIRGFRNSRGKILRIVRNPRNNSDGPSTSSDQSGATVVIENSAPLDLNSLLGGSSSFKNEQETNASGTGMLSGATLASMLSSLTEEISKASEELPTEGEEDCDSAACRAAHDELVHCATDLSRIEAKVEHMMSLIRCRIPNTSLKSDHGATVVSTSKPSTSLASFSQRVQTAPRVMRYTSLKDPLMTPSTSAASSIPLTLPIISRTGPVPTFAKPSAPPLRNNDPSAMISKLFSQAKTVEKQNTQEKLVEQKKKLARALLLFPGTEFTYGEFCEKTPGIVKGLSNVQIRDVFHQLTRNDLLYRDDDELTEGTMKTNTVWQKELSKGKLRNLKKYDISVQEYMERLDYD